LSETRHEYVVTYAALASLGATALTLNIRLHTDEIKYCIDSGATETVITSGTFNHLLEGVRNGSNIKNWISFDQIDSGAGTYETYAHLLKEEHPEARFPDVAASDIHNVLYTSGTTGRPKGAMVSQGA